MADQRDVDPEETREWLDALDSVLEKEGPGRVHELIEHLIDRARRSGIHLPYKATTAYLNTIRKSDESRMPGEPGLEHRIRSINRWNALAMVMKANITSKELGGHLASYASIATLLEVAFNHFLHARTDDHGGDLVYFQGHSAPGIYARAFLEGRLSEDQLLRFRREVDGGGLSSYPHPWLMPDFWQFPTVSMGLSPLMSICQPSRSSGAPSEAVSLACHVQVLPVRTKMFAEPESVPWSSSFWAPMTIVSPLMPADRPKLSLAAPSGASSFACWTHAPPDLTNT